MQIIFVVETNSKSKTDDIYLYNFISNYYSTNGDSYKFVHMNGKANYDNSKTIREINKLKNNYKGNNGSKVIYCIDIDDPIDIDGHVYNENLNKNIISYTNLNHCDLIWFYKDIEELFIGNQVKDKEKIEVSKRFASKKLYKKLDLNLFKSINCNKSSRSSNLISILNKYWKLKD